MVVAFFWIITTTTPHNHGYVIVLLLYVLSWFNCIISVQLKRFGDHVPYPLFHKLKKHRIWYRKYYVAIVFNQWHMRLIPMSFSRAIILFLVSNVESNSIDQRWLEFKVHQLNSRVRVMRGTFLDINTKGHLSDDKKLFLWESAFVCICLLPWEYHNIGCHYVSVSLMP